MCVCVCVWGAKDQKEFGISVRKEKVKRLRGVVSISNEQPLVIRAWIGVATVLAYARVTHHGTYLQSLYGI